MISEKTLRAVDEARRMNGRNPVIFSFGACVDWCDIDQLKKISPKVAIIDLLAKIENGTTESGYALSKKGEKIAYYEAIIGEGGCVTHVVLLSVNSQIFRSRKRNVLEVFIRNKKFLEIKNGNIFVRRIEVKRKINNLVAGVATVVVLASVLVFIFTKT